MNQVKYILTLAFLALIFLAGIPCAALSNEPPLRQGWTADTAVPPAETEHAPASSEQRHLLKSIVKRRLDSSAASPVTLSVSPLAGGRACGYSSKASAAVVAQAPPRYQFLQVYRL